MAIVTNPDSRNSGTPTVEHNQLETTYEQLAAVRMACLLYTSAAADEG